MSEYMREKRGPKSENDALSRIDVIHTCRQIPATAHRVSTRQPSYGRGCDCRHRRLRLSFDITRFGLVTL